MVSIPEKRRVKVGALCRRFEVNTLSNWAKPELTTIYRNLGAGREDFAGAFVMDFASICLRIPLLFLPWKSDVASLKLGDRFAIVVIAC